jgi:microcystin-dependent protein
MPTAPKQTTFNAGTVVPSAYLNAQQEGEAPSAWGVRMEAASSTVIRVPVAGDGAAGSVALRIIGVPCVNTATVTLSLSGTVAGVRDVYAVMDGAGFSLAHTAAGAGAPANSRFIGQVMWSGTSISAIRNMVDATPGHNYLHRAGGPDPIGAADIGAVASNTPINVYEVVATLSGGVLPAAATPGRRLWVDDLGIEYLDLGATAGWRVAGGFTGAMFLAPFSTAPPLFLLCTGQAVTSAAAPRLRARLVADGNRWGADGSGNPLLPPTPGRVPVGAGSGSGLTARALGAGATGVFGEEAHILTSPESANIATADDNSTNNGGSQRRILSRIGQVSNWDLSPAGVNSGGGAAHNNLQPSVALNLFVQT